MKPVLLRGNPSIDNFRRQPSENYYWWIGEKRIFLTNITFFYNYRFQRTKYQEKAQKKLFLLMFISFLSVKFNELKTHLLQKKYLNYACNLNPCADAQGIYFDLFAPSFRPKGRSDLFSWPCPKTCPVLTPSPFPQGWCIYLPTYVFLPTNISI